jgi:hypothetical protein
MGLRGSPPVNLGGMKGAELQGIYVRILCATKIQILFSYPSIAGYSLEEENRRLEKLHSTIKVFVDSSATVLRLVVARSVAPQPEASAGLLVAVFQASFPRHSLFQLVASHSAPVSRVLDFDSSFLERNVRWPLAHSHSSSGGPSEVGSSVLT